MTRIVTPEEAQRLLDTPNSTPGSFDWDSTYINTYGTNFLDAGPDLAHTVIQQAEQIKRLQVATSSLMKSYRELDYAYWWEHHAPGMDTYTPATIEHYGFLPGDMEATDE